MSQFTVTYSAPPPAGTNAAVELVEADYFKIEGGVAIFRKNGRNGGYPETVFAFAPGVWATIEAYHA